MADETIYVERYQGQNVVDKGTFKTMDEAKAKVLAWVMAGAQPAEIICYAVRDIKFNVVRKIDLEFI
jgi:hypothetical protein